MFLATKNGEPFAVKAIDKQQVKKRPFLEKYIKQEMEIMNALSHPNIVKQDTVIESNYESIQPKTSTSWSLNTATLAT